jgi:hypothetical protein
MSESEGQLQDYSVDQLGGFVVMVAGAIGSLLLVVWQSKCHCRMNLCYIFQCERRPPTEEEMKGLKEQANALKNKKDKDKKDKEDKPDNETIIPKAKKSNIKTIKEEIDTADDPLDVLDNNRDVEKADLP